jgi:hypothetical protein
MKNWPLVLLLAFTLVVPFGCQASRAREGDTVTPVFASPVQWTAGESGPVAVRLQAQNKDGSSPRALGFEAVPGDVNPRAKVTFYSGQQPLSDPVEVELSHRC